MADEIAQKTAMVNDPEKLANLRDEYNKDKKIHRRVEELSVSKISRVVYVLTLIKPCLT
jgi:hypothetical protein